jgi:hypothetical protein
MTAVNPAESRANEGAGADRTALLLKTQNRQVETLARQLENACGRVRDIAVKAVAGPQGSMGKMSVNQKAPADDAEQAWPRILFD